MNRNDKTKAQAYTNLADFASGIVAQLFAPASQTGNTALQEEAIAAEPSTYHHSAGR